MHGQQNIKKKSTGAVDRKLLHGHEKSYLGTKIAQ